MKTLTKVLSSVALFGAMTMTAQAAVINYEGAVTTTTGAMIGLIPPPLPAMDGFIEYDDTAIAGGLAGPGDILGMQVNIGAICVAIDVAGCAPGTIATPITMISAAAVTFDALGNPTGGSMTAVGNLTTPITLTLPVIFDLTAGTWSADGGFFGTVGGTFAPAVIPVPAAAWLFGSALLGLAGVGRKRKAA